MNAELIAIRNNLKCGHCLSVFVGSDSQAWKVKYEKRVVYCSAICRASAMRNLFGKPAPNRGPCKFCGKEFFSKTAKIFCSMRCYAKSDHMQDMLAQNLAKAVRSTKEARARGEPHPCCRGQHVPCLECEVKFYQKRESKDRPLRRFCSRPCYRSFLAKRFDRWVANPEGLALPQCYDEFLDREELECIVEGCTWRGQWLSMHVNMVHGVSADQFKRAAGFNLSSGIVAKPLAVILRQRQGIGGNPDLAAVRAAPRRDDIVRYKSLEALEHHIKARALIGPGPERHCLGCGAVFVQSTAFGKALYCSIACRNTCYARQKKVVNPKQRLRMPDGTFKWVDPKRYEEAA